MDYQELGRMIKTKTLRTERLILRPFCDRDEDGLLELFRDENTMRMDGDRPILEKNGEFFRRIDLIKNGAVDVSDCISAAVLLQDGQEWFDRLHAAEPGLTKVVLLP